MPVDLKCLVCVCVCCQHSRVIVVLSASLLSLLAVFGVWVVSSVELASR